MYYETEQEKEIIKYLPLVQKIVNRLNLKNRDYDKEDLFNIGVIGLMDALKKYDKSKNVPFESYASIRIKGAIIDEIRKTSSVSRPRIGKLNAFYQAKEELEKVMMRTPTEKEICEKMGINEKELKKIHQTVHQLSSTSLESMIFNEDGSDVELIEVLEDPRAVHSEAALLEKERKQLLTKAVRKLNEREQNMLNLYYVEELSLKEIAYIFDVSVPRVSQIHGKILLQIKDYMRRQYDD